jgi:hypothetical protein
MFSTEFSMFSNMDDTEGLARRARKERRPGGVRFPAGPWFALIWRDALNQTFR